MRRRSFLATGLTTVSACTAGCTSLAPTSDLTHQFADQAVTVRVAENTDTPHDVHEIAQEALDFWEANSTDYVDFAIDFEVVTGSNPDMIIQFADTPSGCEAVPGFSERVLGCAPLLLPGQRKDPPVIAKVVAAARPRGKITTTTEHEIGHILGLGHQDEPRHIMSDQPRDRIPMFDHRLSIWETVLEANQISTDAIRLYNHATTMWNDAKNQAAREAYGTAAADFDAAATKFSETQAATSEFEGHPRVETVNLEGLRGLLDRLEGRSRAASGFASSMSQAATARLQEDIPTASDRVDDANEYIRAFNDIQPVELRDVSIALGLVRGFTRDESVVDVDAEEQAQ